MSDQGPYNNASDFEKYFSGNLSDAKKRALEEQIEEGSFEAEAFEGFNSLGDNAKAASAINDIKKQLAKRTGLKSERKLVFPLWKSLGIAASVLIFLVAGFFLTEFMSKESTVAENETENTSDFIPEKSQDLNTTLEETKAVFLDSLPSQEAKETIAEKLEEEISEDSKLNKEEIQAVKEEEEASSFSNELASEPEEMISNDELSVKKAVEADDLATEVLPPPASDVSSTNKRSAGESGFTGVEQTTETETLADAPAYGDNSYFEIGKKNYGEKKYTDAIVYFQNSLSKGQREVESNYYTAMSYYSMDKTTKAIKYFNFVLNNQGSALRYNAMWYKAIILDERGDKEGAKALLQQLANGSSGFKNQAADKLKSFK